MGRLGSDVEMKQAGSTQVAKCSLATSKTFKDKEGNKQEKTCWHNLEAWGRTAEVMAGYLSKGSKIVVVGEIDNQTYEKDGEKKYVSKVRVNEFHFADAKSSPNAEKQNQDNMDIPF
jgi:single-strand DNA-binding protein